MGVGNFNQRECGTLEYIGMAYMQCIAWCTPVLSARDYVYLFVVKQLKFEVWVALIVAVILVKASVVLFSSVAREHLTFNNVFNLALTVYATPSPVEPLNTPIRIIVMTWLWASLILRTAYEGEMKVIHVIYLFLLRKKCIML